MKHASDAALDTIEPLLAELRLIDGMRERKRGVFYRNSRAFIHFHEDPAGVFADIGGGGEWLRCPVNTPAECREFIRLATDHG